MTEEASLEFRLKKNDETRNYLLEKTKQWFNEKYKKTCKYLNYVKHLFILVLTVPGSVWISAFVSLVCLPVEITCSAVGIKISAITQELKSICQL